MPTTSKRGYCTIAECDAYIGNAPATTTLLQINMAEEIVDEYLGPQDRLLSTGIQLEGLAAAGGASQFTLESYQQNTMYLNYLKGCWVEVIGGTGAGNRSKITGSTFEGVITTEDAVNMDSTSYYRIWQLGKFPRKVDCSFDNRHTPNQWYKQIPEKLREATICQVEFLQKMGLDYFNTDKVYLDQERIGDYQYRRASGSGGESALGTANLIAPKTKILLRGLARRTGRITD